MTIWVLLTLAGAGLVIGFLSGLVGIGGGVLIVPLLYFFYAHAGWSGVGLAPELHAVVAHATSLFVILPTSALGTWTYHRAGAVAWRAALPIAGFSVVAALIGAQLAPGIPAPLLKLGFGILLLVSGVRLLRSGKVAEAVAGRGRRARVQVAAASGAVIGLMSALLGVGGGIVAIPILIYFVGVAIKKVAATSMAIIAFTALAGVVGYAVGGLGQSGLPSGSFGYVHYLAGLPILVGSMVAVSWGARVNQRIESKKLEALFGLLFIVLGLRLLIQNVWVLGGSG